MLHIWDEPTRALGTLMRGLTFLAVFGLSIGLAACEGSAAGTCSTAADVGAKLTALTDDLEAARAAGKLDNASAGGIAAKIVEAGAKFGTGRDRRAYCGALDQVRKDAGL